MDAANRTLSWAVAEQPWHDGDLLMVRIKREVVPEVALKVNVPATIRSGTELPPSPSAQLTCRPRTPRRSGLQLIQLRHRFQLHLLIWFENGGCAIR